MSEDQNIRNLREKLETSITGYVHPSEPQKRKSKYSSFNKDDKEKPYVTNTIQTYKKLADDNTLCPRCSKSACGCNR